MSDAIFAFSWRAYAAWCLRLASLHEHAHQSAHHATAVGHPAHAGLRPQAHTRRAGARRRQGRPKPPRRRAPAGDWGATPLPHHLCRCTRAPPHPTAFLQLAAATNNTATTTATASPPRCNRQPRPSHPLERQHPRRTPPSATTTTADPPLHTDTHYTDRKTRNTRGKGLTRALPPATPPSPSSTPKCMS